MATSINVRAEWDDDAKVWVASSNDVPGLITEASTSKELEEKLQLMIPELMELNGVQHGKSIPFHLHEVRDLDLQANCCTCA